MSGRTHCRNGHDLTVEGALRSGGGGRMRCAQCARNAQTRWRRSQGMSVRVMDAAERFATKYQVNESTGCWVWLMECDPDGYARFRGDAHALAHRWAYEHFVGPIPEGYTVDHLCHNDDLGCSGGPECQHRKCVNPAHLDAVPTAVNTKRAAARRQRARMKGFAAP